MTSLIFVIKKYLYGVVTENLITILVMLVLVSPVPNNYVHI